MSFAERLSEKKIQKLLLSKQQRHIYEIQERERRLRQLAEQRNGQHRREKRSSSQSSLSPSHSSGYGSVLCCDEQDSTSLKRRRSHQSQTPTPCLKRFKDNAGLMKLKKPPKGEYVVERIECVEVVTFQPVFFVKWLGYSKHMNTWESFSNLADCAEMEDFVETKMQFFEVEIAQISSELEAELKEKPLDVNSVGIEEVDAYEPLELKVDLILLAQYRAANSRSQKEPERIGKRVLRRLHIRNLYFIRRQQLHDLAQFEERMNKVELPSPPIKVENQVDFDVIDPNFVYIQKNILGQGVPKAEVGIVGCKCQEDGAECAPTSRCCARLAGELFAYDKTKARLRLQPGSAIYECNSRCSCDSTCSNRLVQHGRQHELTLFKTSNGSGWGVRTPQSLRKGTFVCEYIGEIITSDEANERGKVYDDRGRTYLFDLDYNTAQDSEFTIDAANYGNISHFINHSCDPNLAVFPCWIEHLNVALPHLVFFTLRHIKAGEELSFDYIRADNEDVPYENLSTATRVECRCGAPNCRKVLF